MVYLFCESHSTLCFFFFFHRLVRHTHSPALNSPHWLNHVAVLAWLGYSNNYMIAQTSYSLWIINPNTRMCFSFEKLHTSPLSHCAKDPNYSHVYLFFPSPFITKCWHAHIHTLLAANCLLSSSQDVIYNLGSQMNLNAKSLSPADEQMESTMMTVPGK